MADQPRFRRLRRFSFGGSDLRRAIDDEIASHLEHTVRELVASGMDPREAEEEALAALTGSGEPEAVGAVNVWGNFFSVMGVPPLLGRGFRRERSRGSRRSVPIRPCCFSRSEDLWLHASFKTHQC